MTSWARALLGVALGSCLTLFIHRESRPYMTGLVPRPAEAKSIRTMSGAGVGPLEAPRSTAEAGLWMQLGCGRLAMGQTLSKVELQSLAGLARYMENWQQPSQFDNAFWPQMEAMFLDQLGEKDAAKKAWLEATKCTRWRDFQTARLMVEADDSSAPLAWHFAGLYYERRSYAGAAILDFAHRLVSGIGEESTNDLSLRYATLVNAHLIAEGAQSVDMFRFATAIANLAIQPPDSPDVSEDLALRGKARGRFYLALNKLGFRDQASSAQADFNLLDAQLAMTASSTRTAAQISAQSIVTATLPDALLIIALIGAILLPLGSLALNFSLDHKSFEWPPALMFGGVLGVAAIWLSLPVLAGLVVLLCCLFLIFTPKNERSRMPSELGPLFSLTVGVLAVAFIVAVACSLAAASTPARLLLPSILRQNPARVGNQYVLLLGGFATLLFCLFLLMAPMWAFMRRIRTPLVFGLALRTFGTVLLAAGLAGTVILGPLCIYEDLKAKKTLSELVSNEPQHYYNIFQ